eukprot:g3151.t1
MKQLAAALTGFGLAPGHIEALKRWDRVQALRNLSTQALWSGDARFRRWARAGGRAAAQGASSSVTDGAETSTASERPDPWAGKRVQINAGESRGRVGEALHTATGGLVHVRTDEGEVVTSPPDALALAAAAAGAGVGGECGARQAAATAAAWKLSLRDACEEVARLWHAHRAAEGAADHAARRSRGRGARSRLMLRGSHTASASALFQRMLRVRAARGLLERRARQERLRRRHARERDTLLASGVAPAELDALRGGHEQHALLMMLQRRGYTPAAPLPRIAECTICGEASVPRDSMYFVGAGVGGLGQFSRAEHLPGTHAAALEAARGRERAQADEAADAAQVAALEAQKRLEEVRRGAARYGPPFTMQKRAAGPPQDAGQGAPLMRRLQPRPITLPLWAAFAIGGTGTSADMGAGASAGASASADAAGAVPLPRAEHAGRLRAAMADQRQTALAFARARARAHALSRPQPGGGLRGGGESWQHKPCGHMFCVECMRAYAEGEAAAGRAHIRCPGLCCEAKDEGDNRGNNADGGRKRAGAVVRCTNQLYPEDVSGLVSAECYERWSERRAADYRRRLEEVLGGDEKRGEKRKRGGEGADGGDDNGEDGGGGDGDDGLRKFVRENCRPCPACHVIVLRSEGCDAMVCTCGTRFCYRCGEEKDDSSMCACRRNVGGVNP